MKGSFDKPLQKHSDKHLELKRHVQQKGSPQSPQELILYKECYKYLLVVLSGMTREVRTHDLRGDTSGCSLVSVSVVLDETKDGKSWVQLAGHISLEGTVTYNLEQTAHALDKPISEVKVVALDRDRHADLFREIRASGAQLELLGDGDVSGAIWAAKDDGPFDLLMGIGAAPEGVISATAIRGLGGVFEGTLVFRSPGEEARAGDMIDDDLTRLWKAHDLCQSEDAIFAASGVCDGYLPAAELGDGFGIAHSEIIDVQAKTVEQFSTRRPL